jgi:hypothetical protein
MNEVNLALVNQFLLQKQHLANNSKIDDILQISNDVSGLHATGPTTPYLSLFARSETFLRKDLENELYVKKRLGRIRCMRGTLHVLAEEMIPVAYAATRRMSQKDVKDFLAFRGVSTREYEETSRSILNILRGTELTSSEIKERLGTDVNVPAIVEQMCEQGLLIRGRPRRGWKDRVNKYSILREVFPNMDLASVDEMEARTLLVHRYLRSFGPVTKNDIAWWIGISKTETHEALSNLQDQTEQITISDLPGDYILLKSHQKVISGVKIPGSKSVNLLPSLDPYLMGYKDRERYLSKEHRDRVFDRGGNATSTILLNGRAVGVWDFSEEKKPLLKMFLFERFEEGILKQIHLEAKRIGRFMANEEVQLTECDSMIPLTRKTAGGFMFPLKNS